MKFQAFSRIATLGALVIGSLLTGCASRTKMALLDDADKAVGKEKPIYLMTATLKNGHRTSFQPRLLVVNVERNGGKESADRLNFIMDDKARNETGTQATGNEYLLRMELPAGDYVVRGLTSMASTFPIHGYFFTPLHADVKTAGPGVFYLGHVDATVRSRQEGEFRAGPAIPLIDQAVAGASNGTFDIVISDRWETDESKFLDRFPVLKGVAVQKAVLPPFDRAKAQAIWAAN